MGMGWSEARIIVSIADAIGDSSFLPAPANTMSILGSISSIKAIASSSTRGERIRSLDSDI